MSGGGSFTSDQGSSRIASTGQFPTVSGGSTNNQLSCYLHTGKGSGAFATDASVILRDGGASGLIKFEGHFKRRFRYFCSGSGIRFKTNVHVLYPIQHLCNIIHVIFYVYN